MLKRLLIALAQLKAGNNSEILLNEISQILCISQKKLLKKYTITWSNHYKNGYNIYEFR